MTQSRQPDLCALVTQLIQNRAITLALKTPELLQPFGQIDQHTAKFYPSGLKNWQWVDGSMPPQPPAPPLRPQRWLERKIYMMRSFYRGRRNEH